MTDFDSDFIKDFDDISVEGKDAMTPTLVDVRGRKADAPRPPKGQQVHNILPRRWGEVYDGGQ